MPQRRQGTQVPEQAKLKEQGVPLDPPLNKLGARDATMLIAARRNFVVAAPPGLAPPRDVYHGGARRAKPARNQALRS